MNLEVLAFWILAVTLVGSALAVVLTKNLFHSVLWLALALTGTAGLFLTLEADFLAGVQILLYTGGVITVVVFAIVVTEKLVGETLSHTSRHIGIGALVAALLGGAVISAVRHTPADTVVQALPTNLTHDIGVSILRDHALAFELLGVVLLTSLVAAIYFARPED